ncbi:MAG TPA: PfkB family carbohydrate kinase [Paracoccaceae bacterium]|nr:PfkB family carbohydrate kinase [Paracoccaceae bacterium]
MAANRHQSRQGEEGAEVASAPHPAGDASARPRIFCIGGACIDCSYRALAPVEFETSNPVDARRGFGGVARNVAENLARLGVATSLLTIVGEDANGGALTGHLRALGIGTGAIVTAPEKSTAEYAAILGPDGGLVLGAADMGIFDLLTPAHLEAAWPEITGAEWVFADCNLPAELIGKLLAWRPGASFRLAIDAVSAPKALRLPKDLAGLDMLFLNLREAAACLGAGLPPRAAIARLFERGAAGAVLTMGAEGALVADATCICHVPAVPARPVEVTGAGDAMIAGCLFGLLAGANLAEAARTGTLLAALTSESTASVHPELSPSLLERARNRLPEPRNAPAD